jgi:hypothetical protein
MNTERQAFQGDYMSINGRLYDWQDITILMPHGEAIGITDISYSDEQPVTARYGKGGKPRGYGRGNYAGSGSFTIDLDEWERLSIALVATGKGSIYDHIPFPIVVSYASDDGIPVTDTIPLVKITKLSTSNKQGSDNVGAKSVEFTILETIVYNGKPSKL